MLCEQSLVGGHHGLACLDRGLEHRSRRPVLTADELDDEVELRRASERNRIVEPCNATKINPAIARSMSRRHRGEHDLPPGKARKRHAPRRQNARHGRTDGPEAGKAEAKRSFVLGHERIK